MCKIREMNLETAKYYGYEAQSNQLVEECAELIQAVNKYRRVETGLGQPVAEDKKAIARDNLVADDTTTGYKSLGYHWSHSNGYQSAFGIDPEHPELLIPTEASGSDVFTGNYVWQNYTYNGFLVAILGGVWSGGSNCGFSLSGSSASGSRYRDVGGRLLYVPQTQSILIFPEGSHNYDLNRLIKPLYDGPVNLALKTGKKNVPVALVFDFLKKR